MLARICTRLFDPLFHVRRNTVELDTPDDLMALMGWSNPPILIEDDLDETLDATDANRRRRLDADTLSRVARNIDPAVCLDIGTHHGRSAARMAVNAPRGRVYTVNMPPEEAANAGRLITESLSREEIGKFVREKSLGNVVQIYANTKTWRPDFSGVELAYIDGCHDTEFVFADSVKALSIANPEKCFILWHDFNPALVRRYGWIESAMRGVERLLRKGVVAGPIYHVRNSWIGICHARGSH